jgi:hypothetical protein
MRYPPQFRRTIGAVALAGTGLFAWPTLASADVSGDATAVRSTVLGITTTLADSGNLAGAGDMEQASQLTGGIGSVLTSDVLHATTAAAPDAVVSQASLGDVALTLVGNSISAGTLLAQATAPASGPASGFSDIEGLVVNGTPIVVTGQPNQVIWLIGGQIILNEQHASSGGMVVNAVHVIVTGVADVVLASANARMSGVSLPPPPPLPLFGVLDGSAAHPGWSRVLTALSSSSSGSSRWMAYAPSREAALTI